VERMPWKEVVWQLVWADMAAMEGNHWSLMKAPNVMITKSEKRNRLASRARTSRKKGKKGNYIISHCLFLTFK